MPFEAILSKVSREVSPLDQQAEMGSNGSQGQARCSIPGSLARAGQDGRKLQGQQELPNEVESQESGTNELMMESRGKQLSILPTKAGSNAGQRGEKWGFWLVVEWV